MKKRWLLVVALFALPAFAEVPAGPVALPATRPVARLFRSRLAGIELVPPAGGTLIRQLDTGEIVRFVYADHSWDIRVKPVPLHMAMTLPNLLDLTATQLVQANASAEIVSKKVFNQNIGIIEARYNAGADRLFTQQALIREDDQSYYMIQMGSPTDKPKNAPAIPADPKETDAENAFNTMVLTVKLLDRNELGKEIKLRAANTRALWVLLDRRKITEVLDPQHFIRIVRDGKDIGFVQVNEREASHADHPGVEVIVRSRVLNLPDEILDQPKAPAASAAPTDPNAVVVGGLAPKVAGPATQPSNIYTLSDFFFSFDRVPGFVSAHEDWETLTQMDQNKSDQVFERANSDISVHRALDRIAAAASLRKPTTQAVKDRQPPVVERDEYTLVVSQDVKNRRAPSIERKLLWFYLPQGLRQLLPRLLPLDEPKQYMFATYLSEQHEVMARYVDVDRATDVVLDGRVLHAVPISDRIGVDGLPTIHYMSSSGQWLGSVSEEGRVEVLPATENELKQIWPNFAVSPLPPVVDPVHEGLSDPH